MYRRLVRYRLGPVEVCERVRRGDSLEVVRAQLLVTSIPMEAFHASRGCFLAWIKIFAEFFALKTSVPSSMRTPIAEHEVEIIELYPVNAASPFAHGESSEPPVSAILAEGY